MQDREGVRSVPGRLKPGCLQCSSIIKAIIPVILFILIGPNCHGQSLMLLRSTQDPPTTMGSMKEFRSQLLFTLQGSTGWQMWKSNGTVSGTRPAVDIIPNSTYSTESYPMILQTIIDLQGRTLFSAYDDVHGWEPWVTDGTTQGTQIMQDIIPGSDSSYPADMIPLGNRVILPARAPDGLHYLWVTDGTKEGTFKINRSSSDDGEFTGSWTIIDRWLFCANGERILQTDGTETGTINHGSLYLSSPFHLTPCNGILLFSAVWPQLSPRQPGSGNELFFIKFQGGNSKSFIDINPGPASSNPSDFVSYRNHAYFTADTGSAGRLLWRTDGTTSGTQPVGDRLLGSAGTQARKLVVKGDELYFISNDAKGTKEIWSSDETTTGTRLIAKLPGPAGGADPHDLTPCGNHLFFYYDDGLHGDELWKTLDTPPGAAMVQDLNPGTASSWFSRAPHWAGGKLYLYANGGSQGVGIWVYDENRRSHVTAGWTQYP